MMFFIKKTEKNTIEIWCDDAPKGKKSKPFKVAKIEVYQAPEFYIQKFRDTVVRRWNFLTANELIERELLNRRTGEIEHIITKK